jgi:hypothetical protein
MEPVSPADMEIAQFTIPRPAYGVLNVPGIEALAYAEGFARPRIEANTRHAGGNRIRLTCRVAMARRLVDTIENATRLAEHRHDGVMVADLAIALAATLKGIDQATARIDTRPPMGDTGFLG